MNAKSLVTQVIKYTEKCQIKPGQWQFASLSGGSETLYGSSFACMIYHYVGHLNTLTSVQKKEWANYLNSWQDPQTGYFLGPELVPEEMMSRKHSFEHLSQHLTAHVLPALSLLGAKPIYPLTFAHPFTDLDTLYAWLQARDWRDAWLEGNNLIFVGQFLIYLRDIEGLLAAQPALDLYFEWLDQEVDPATGLWGSNGYCSNEEALYGGYHQLIVYYYENRLVNYPERLVDIALSLQHADGGFRLRGGGGACEDADAIDILVNMYKLVDYKRPQIRTALRRGADHILKRQMPDGGFVYRLDQPFTHMGVQRTASPPNQSNLFSTWFRVHTLALISEILTDEPFAQWEWDFNDSCSMGWHRAWDKTEYSLTWSDRQKETLDVLWRQFRGRMHRMPGKFRRLGGKVKRRVLRGMNRA